VGDHDRGRPQRIVQLADQLTDHAERDRIETGEGLVVHDQHRVEGHGTRQGDATRHAAGQFTWHQIVRATQSDRFQLHQHQIANHFFRHVGVLADRKSDIVEHRHVGEQRTELEQHAHLSAQCVQLVVRHLAHLVFLQAHAPAARAQLSADTAQQGGLAAAGSAHDGDHLAARNLHVDSLQHRAAIIIELEVFDIDQNVV